MHKVMVVIHTMTVVTSWRYRNDVLLIVRGNHPLNFHRRFSSYVQVSETVWFSQKNDDDGEMTITKLYFHHMSSLFELMTLN